MIPSRANTTAHRGRRVAFAALIVGLCIHGSTVAADATPEHGGLAAALRQLDSIDRIVAQTQAGTRETRSRYHFDYDRLAADLARVRAGIRDYLSPSRAQPRDPLPIAGDYRRDASADAAHAQDDAP